MPAALQGKNDSPTRRERIRTKGREAAAGDVLVKFRRKLRRDEHAQMSTQMDADRSEDIGSTGVRLIHSKGFTTETLLGFLASHPDVEFVEPNY